MQHVIRQEAQRGSGLFIALIDGHGDLVRNVNDPEETADYVAALHAIGDCVAPRGVHQAILEGTRVARVV